MTGSLKQTNAMIVFVQLQLLCIEKVWVDTRRPLKWPQASRSPSKFLSTAWLLSPSRSTVPHAATLCPGGQEILLPLLPRQRFFSEAGLIDTAWPLSFEACFLCHLAFVLKSSKFKTRGCEMWASWKYQSHCKNQYKWQSWFLKMEHLEGDKSHCF